VKNRNDLLYDLIFSEQTTFQIDIAEYVQDIYKNEDFVSDIKKILKKSKVAIVLSSISYSSKTAMWELKVKK